jgi:hypothetical protein
VKESAYAAHVVVQLAVQGTTVGTEGESSGVFLAREDRVAPALDGASESGMVIRT